MSDSTQRVTVALDKPVAHDTGTRVVGPDASNSPSDRRAAEGASFCATVKGNVLISACQSMCLTCGDVDQYGFDCM